MPLRPFHVDIYDAPDPNSFSYNDKPVNGFSLANCRSDNTSLQVERNWSSSFALAFSPIATSEVGSRISWATFMPWSTGTWVDTHILTSYSFSTLGFLKSTGRPNSFCAYSATFPSTSLPPRCFDALTAES